MNTPAADRFDNQLLTPAMLQDENSELLAELEAFERKAAAIPPAVDTDDHAGPLVDLIADMDKFGRKIEERRDFTKTPYESAVAITNAFFFGLHAPRRGQTPGRLQHARDLVANVVTAYHRMKEERAKAAAREAARIAEEQRQAALRRAQEEATKAREAEEAGRKRAAANATQRAAEATAAASQADAAAFEAQQQLTSKPAEIARTRSDGGALASPQVEWTFEIPDIDKVKGALLWPYITEAARKRRSELTSAPTRRNMSPRARGSRSPE